MKVLCVLNEKGGVGKTTLCACLIWHFVDTGRSVLAIDLDQQGNLSHTIAGAETFPATNLFESRAFIPVGRLTLAAANLEILDLEQTRDETVPAAFHDNLRAADGAFDICIIDTPPSLGVRVVAALLAADATVAPVDLGDYSIIGIQRVLDFQARVAELYEVEQPQFFGLIASRFDRKSPRERALYEQLVEAGRDGVPLFPLYLSKRDAYARSSAEQVPPWKMVGTAAREASTELRGVMAEFDRLLDTIRVPSVRGSAT